jgi:hypothetical protein
MYIRVGVDDMSDRIKKELDVKNDLFGGQFITNLTPSAGKSAAKSGKLFEDITYSKLIGDGRIIKKRPKFKCHFGLDRKGDFEIVAADRTVHVECKQLGNVESHFDKLSHVFMNLVFGCYGKEMWLVYDYDGAKNKIRALVKRGDELKQQVALQGITFELILIDNLQEKMRGFLDEKHTITKCK